MRKSGKMIDFTKIKEMVFSKNGSIILVIIGFIGIGLIFVSQYLPTSTSKASSTSSTSTTDQYAKKTESQLENIIGQISGVGKVKVMVTVGSGVEYVYEQNVKTSTDTTKNNDSSGTTQTQQNSDEETNPVVVENASGGQQALVKTEIQPKVTGVVIVCDGGDDSEVCESIVNTVTTALDLPANHVSVSKRNITK
ncbi:MAG TPA: hypothetical protein VHR42_10305 [Clostridia bacterium]|nr:hypothetical protein [Clostridia bacterium]